MRILVTGSAGFIGFHVAKMLLRKRHVVIGVDNFNDHYAVSLKRARTLELGTRNYTCVEGDCANSMFMRGAIKRHAPDVVCHLAARPGVRYSMEHPFACAHSNLDGFVSVLEACRQNGVRRLVYASSSSVYGADVKRGGGGLLLPFDEKDRTDAPISLYAATKRANELMAHAYTHLYGIQTIGLRFFTVYGPWGRPDMAMWSFTESMLAGKTIPVYGTGGGDVMRRDFTFVADIAPAVVAALSADNLSPCEILNLGNHKPESVMHVIELLSNELGVEPKLELCPSPPSDPIVTYADSKLAREKLGFVPTTSISVGIPLFVEWFRGYHREKQHGG